MFSKYALIGAVLLAAYAADTIPAGSDLTVHEWGTFTSVAGTDGAPVAWAALKTANDLPCFVNRLSAICVKCNATSLVRMETPVVYFYSKRPETVSVHVDLPSGVITEWYPKATGVPRDVTYGNNGKIDWNTVQLLPGAAPEYPKDSGPSHYYAARNTDSASLRVEEQQEKLLFYRGVMNAGVALGARLMADGKMQLRNTGWGAIPFAVVFENRGGRTGYRVVRDVGAPVTVELPELGTDVAELHRDLADALVSAGLYPKEAAAMVETWRDSWFEDGMRVFYILPRNVVDTVLPLRIAPAPSKTERVFVGRVEVLSPSMKESLRTALAAGDTETLKRCARFLEPFIEQMTGSVVLAPASRQFIEAARAERAHVTAPTCKDAAPAVVTEGQ